jgi:predicted secreted protein
MLRRTATAAGLLWAPLLWASLLWASLLWASLLWASPARAETLLHLTDTETVTVAPDELAASLRAEASSANPADAQQRVNAAMADALAHARKVAGVTASTGAYSVWHVGPTPQDSSERWQASQSLELTSHDSVALLTLLGTLQQNGLAVGELGWRLSREAERKAHDEATRQALAALRGKAQEAAGLLDLRFGSFKQVRLDGTAQVPTPRFVGAMAAMAAPAPPNAVATDVPVSATAEADAILLPK